MKNEFIIEFLCIKRYLNILKMILREVLIMVALQFKRSVSLVALATALGTTGLFTQSIVSTALAANINYGGAADVGQLQSDPTSETGQYKSLYPNAAASQSTNVITVNGNVSSGSAVNGRDVWNTDSSDGKIVAAPFLIYGGVNIGANGTSDNVNGAAGADISGNSIVVKDVQYDWTGQDARNTIENGGSYKSGSTGAMGGGSVIGGLSIGGGGSTSSGGGSGAKGGNLSNMAISLTNVTLIGSAGAQGSAGGLGERGGFGGGGAGGLGGGSVVGGISIGGASSDGDGGAGGAIINNSLNLDNVVLIAGSGGAGGIGGSDIGGRGAAGLNGGSVFGGISIGGAADTEDSSVLGRGGNGGDVSDNSIKISGNSSIGGNIYGGYSQGGSGNENNKLHGQGGAVINNTVTLEGADIKIGTRGDNNDIVTYGAIYGGYSVNGDGSINTGFDRVIAGNTLNLNGYRGTVSGIYNFETYNWLLPSNVVNGDTLVKIAEGGTAVDLTNTKHNVAMYNDGSRLNVGDRVNLIDKTQGSWTASSTYRIEQGSFIIYEASLVQQADDNHALVLTINDKAVSGTDTGGGSGSGNNNGGSSNSGDNNGSSTGSNANQGSNNTGAGSNNDTMGQSAARLNPQSKSYAEGRAAALGFVTQGNDLISTGINGLRAQAFTQGSNAKTAFVPFIIMNGSSQRYETGSHVDIKGFNMALGLATGLNFAGDNKATLGAFFEYGRGTYDTYNSFTNFASVYGDGNSDYKGGGIFGRIDFAGTGLGRVNELSADQADGVYLEASLRAGRASSKFDVGHNMTALGLPTSDYRGSYDSTVTYYGGHVSGGYVFNFDEKQALDVFGRYLWTHMDSDTVTIGYEQLHFGSATSSRIQIGGRYAYAYNAQFKPYIGAAYEHEFDGDISARAYEFNLDKPSLKGDSGIFEAGFNLQPVATNKQLSIDVNGQGYAGERQGGGGGVKVKYQF